MTVDDHPMEVEAMKLFKQGEPDKASKLQDKSGRTLGGRHDQRGSPCRTVAYPCGG